MKKIILFIVCLPSMLYCLSPYYMIRSQGENDARELAGWVNEINLDSTCNYGTIAGTVEYTRSFNPRAIMSCLFGPNVIREACNCDPALGISGSRSPNRLSTDFLADYFGLPSDFTSTVVFKPLIQNCIIDLDFYYGFDSWVKGLYIRIDAPITYTKWNMRMQESVLFTGTQAANAGYYSTGPISTMLTSFSQFITGAAALELPSTTIGSQTFSGGTFNPLSAAKVSTNPQVAMSIAELRAIVGWNYAQDRYHVGSNLRFAAPTGTKPRGIYMFEPIVGNGHHWQVGVGVTGHYDFWIDECNHRYAGLYIDANINHLANTRQRRTFDLKGKPNSRYMLAEKISPPVANNLQAGTINPGAQFKQEFTTVANLTTFDVYVSIAAQGELVALVNYTDDCWSFDLGYDFWATTCQKIKKACPRTSCSPCSVSSTVLNPNTWALKGDAYVYGFASGADATAPTLVAGQPIALSATESNATINGGTNFPSAGLPTPAQIRAAQSNPGIDSPALAFAGGSHTALLGVNNLGINTSMSPVFIDPCDIDFAGTRGLSNKVFADFSYTWLEKRCWVPYLAFGAEAEFGKGCCTDLNPCIDGCPTCSLSQWGVWLKGGVSF